MSSIRTINDIEFARKHGSALLMDLHLPESAGREGRLPVIVWIHGGGWRQGSRLTPPVLAVEHGYALASIDYQLTPGATWPAQLDDCKDAITFLRQETDRYDLDSDRIAAWGKSAGGHLVALLAVLSGLPGNENASWRIQAAGDYCGPSDLELFVEPKWRSRFELLHEVICDLLGGPIELRREQARDASPIRFANARCAPMRIVHGDLDDVVPVEEGESLYKALKKIGADVELEVIGGLGHHIASVEIDTRTLQFFDRYLKPKAKRELCS